VAYSASNHFYEKLDTVKLHAIEEKELLQRGKTRCKGAKGAEH